MALLNNHIREIEAIFQRIEQSPILALALWLTLLEFFVGLEALLDDAHVGIEVGVEGADVLESLLWRLPALDLLEEAEVREHDCRRPRQPRSAVHVNIEAESIDHVVKVLGSDE